MLLLMLVMWACGCQFFFVRLSSGFWAAGVVCGGGGYLSVMWWQGALIVVEVVVDEQRSCVTLHDKCDVWISI